MLEKIIKKGQKFTLNCLNTLLLLFPTLSLSGLQYGIDAKREGTEPVCNMQIFGERGSGTNYLHSLLWNNLEGSINKDDFNHWYSYCWKHFPLWLNVPFENNPEGSSLRCYTFEESDSYLFVVIFRDPYDWVRSIYLRPSHTKSNMHDISFSEFIRLPWAGYYSIDLNPVTGAYFENVLALRNARMINMLLIKERVKNIYYVRYETLRDYPQEVLKEISEIFDISLNPVFYPITKYKGDENNGEFSGSYYFNISHEDLEFINSQLNESIENEIGYQLIN